MTSEVCIMNRLAAVLAADSATTVTSWVDNIKEERYFKGANKVHQASDHHPVGIMIFDSADMLSVPWEVIIKDFRKSLSAKCHNNVEAYANEFFKFLETNIKMFPLAIQNSYVVNAARNAFVGYCVSIEIPPGAADPNSFMDIQVAERIDFLNKTSNDDAFSDDLTQEIRDLFRDEILSECDQFRDSFPKGYPADSVNLAELAIMEIVREPRRHFSTTGIVFAGFGDDDIFPSMIEYISYGLIAGKLVSGEKNRETIDHNTPAALNAFAQTAMADTFMVGFGLDAYISFGRAVSDGLAAFAKDVCVKTGGDLGKMPDFDQEVATKSGEISSDVLDESRRRHAAPLRRVLGALPVDEMAELAETLINLQSLKEKVTKPSASVGGPVDVAVITRAEGLIWIRRKHFFDPALNPRYIQRQAAALK